MSDSECDLIQNKFYNFQHERSAISAKGGNKILTNLNFERNNMLTSTMLMPQNIERSGHGEHSYYHNSMYNRRDRDTSPASIRSAQTVPRQNFLDVYQRRNPYSQNSMMNVRGGSPMSVRTMDSTTSMRAVDIAMALKEGQFDNHDLRIIKEAYHKLVKSRMRRKIEKRRKKRLARIRRNSCDSGDQGSDSSLSSLDCNSLKTGSFRDNMSSCRSTRTDLSNFRNTMKECDMYRDCTDAVKQNSFRKTPSMASRSVQGDYRGTQGGYEQLNRLKNTYSTGSKSVYGDSRSVYDAYKRQGTFRNTSTTGNKSVHDYRASQSFYGDSLFKAPMSVCSDTITRKPSAPAKQDLFKNRFVLPSQRFNKSVASLTVLENTSKDVCIKPVNQCKTSRQQNKVNKSLQSKQFTTDPTDSDDDDDMFSQIAPNKRKEQNNRKRSLDTAESNITPTKKKKNNISPRKQPNIADEESVLCGNSSNNDFNFIKPSLPAKKSLNGKTNEIIVARSAPPVNFKSLPANLAKTTRVSAEHQEEPTNTTQMDTSNAKNAEMSQNSLTDVSTRPSFIKRKLFSQKLDVTEAKDKPDSSSESPQVDSYKSLIRERTKARKLVTNTSCLSRDISGVNSNLLDLIHKIVPAEQMNMTNAVNQANKNETKNSTDPEDKWDVTTAISTCNNKDNVSDTFTDDELFCFTTKTDKKDVKTKAKDVVNPVSPPKKVTSKSAVTPSKVAQKSSNKLIGEKKISFSCVDNFFDTDYETDSESRKVDKQIMSKPMSKDPTPPKTVQQKANEIVKNQNTMSKKPKNNLPEKLNSKKDRTPLKADQQKAIEIVQNQNTTTKKPKQKPNKANNSPAKLTSKKDPTPAKSVQQKSNEIVKNQNTKTKIPKQKTNKANNSPTKLNCKKDRTPLKADQQKAIEIVQNQNTTTKKPKQKPNKANNSPAKLTSKKDPTPAKSVQQKSNEIVKNQNTKTKIPKQKTNKANNSPTKLNCKKDLVIEIPKLKGDFKSSTSKVNSTIQKSESSKNSKNNKTKPQIDSNENINNISSDHKDTTERSKTDNKRKTQTNTIGKEKKNEESEKKSIQKTSKRTQKKNNVETEKIKPQVEIQSNEQKTDTALNKDKISKTKHKSNTNAKIEDNNLKETEQKNKPGLNKELKVNNRSRRINTPRSQKENIPINNTQMRSGNKSNKKSVSKKSGTAKQVMQDSFTLLENINAKNPESLTNNLREDSLSLNASMTLRSHSRQDIDEIPKPKKNAKTINKPNTKIEAKIHACDMNRSMRPRNNKKNVSYVY